MQLTSIKISLNKSFTIINMMVMIVFLQNPPWFLWDYYYPILCFCVFISSIAIFDRVNHLPKNKLYLIFFTLILISFFVIFSSLQQFRSSSIITIIVFFQLFTLRQEEKISILNKITSILSFIVFISLSFWLINQFIYELPVFREMSYETWKGDAGQTVIDNYFFFVQEKNKIFHRFYSIFDEPGVLGTLSAFILFANNYNFKDKKNIIILVGAFFTFSLAFYLLTFIGLMLCYGRKPINLIITTIVIIIASFILPALLKENQAFQFSIIYRLSNKNEDSFESRTSNDLNKFFPNYIKSSDSILGMGTSFFDNNKNLNSGQGYQLFLIEYGFVGLFLVLGMYSLFHSNNKYLAYSYLLLFLLSFLQRPFLFTPWQLIVFHSGVSLFDKKLEKKPI
jgi:hypothetical protein